MNNVLYKNTEGNHEYGMILIHGRGADAEDIMQLSDYIKNSNILFAAPRAPGNTWYPYSFLAPINENQPYLDNSLKIIDNLFEEMSAGGIPQNKIILAGFSQGACLALEYAYRHPKKYGAVAALSGGIISTNIRNNIDFKGTQVFLGCSANDPHIPLERVNFTEELFRNSGAIVKKTIYPGTVHSIMEDEINELNSLAANLKEE